MRSVSTMELDIDPTSRKKQKSDNDTMSSEDPLPVPAQLEAQLGKCKVMRSADSYKPRTKTAAVRTSGMTFVFAIHSID
jgi:hypothetical protein